MNLSIQNYLFLSRYVYLPLHALKKIENEPSHPFHNINELKIQDIQNELISFFKRKNYSIQKISKKAKKVCNLIDSSIFDKITENLEEWKDLGIKVVSFFDEKYPISLKNIKDPPQILFLKGKNSIDSIKSISIVGTRNPTEYGKEMAFKIGQRFAEKGFLIINGFANGVDIEAIKGGLKAGGKIIGVFGSGLLKPYPKENIPLFNEILMKNKGIFISEQLPDKNVIKSSLATRNRISSALSLGSVFIEGSKKSGTKWQLNYAKEQSKSIIVLKPNKILEQTELPRYIIKSEKGVKIIEKIDDVNIIAETIIKSNNSKNTSINDFL